MSISAMASIASILTLVYFVLVYILAKQVVEFIELARD